MKSLMRKIVAGPKKKTPYNGEELDLTYITDRIIAMAYPASNFLEKTFRNSIDDVANYFNEYHTDNYLIFNVSSRPYNYEKFDNRVLQYEWPDHQAPPITTLFQIADKAHQYITKNEKGVIAVHCNHGKGRTGTAIISILLYLGTYRTAQDTLQFYNSRRFSSQTYGVDQPCQTRYIGYVQQVLSMKQIPKKLAAYRLAHVSHKGLHDKHYISIKHVRTSQTLVQKFNFCYHSKIQGNPLIGDLFIQVFEEGWASSKHIARINYNSFFIRPVAEQSIDSLAKDDIKVVFRGQNIKCSKSLDKNFTITLSFEYFCLCHVQKMAVPECECTMYRNSEQSLWRKMIKQSKESPYRQKYSKQQQTETKAKVTSEKGCGEDEEQIYELSKSLSNINSQAKTIGRLKVAKLCKEEQLQEQEIGSDKHEEDEQSHCRRKNIHLNFKNLDNSNGHSKQQEENS